MIRRRRPLDPRVRGAAGDESADDDAHATFLKLFLRLTTRTGEREEKRLNPVGEVRVRVFLKVQWGVSSLFCNTRREFASSFRRRRLSELRLPLRHFPVKILYPR